MTKHITRREFLVTSAKTTMGLALGGVLSGCAPSSVQETNSQGAAIEGVPSVSETFTLTYNTWWPRMADDLVQVIPIFEERLPQVKIEQQVLPYNEWIQKYETTMVAGTAADTFCGNLFISPKFYDPQYHMDFTDLLAADGMNIQETHFITATEIWCGKIYGMPFDLDSNAVFYNKTMVKQYYGKDIWEDMNGQWTIDDWLEIMIACTQDTDGDGRLDQWGADGHMPNHENWNQSMSFTHGGSIFDYESMRYTWDSEIAMSTALMGHQWWTEHKVFVPPEESQAMAAAGVPSPFAGGVAATRYRAVADVPRFINEVGDKFEWDVALLPGLTKDKPGVGLVAGNPNLVNAKTPHPDEAYEWVKFLAGEDVQHYFATQGICVPTLKEMVSEFKKYPGVEHAYVFTEVPQHDYHIHILHFNAIECRNLTGAKMDEIYISGADPETTIIAMNDELNEKVEYGGCAPFVGMQHPIPGGTLVQ